VTAPPAARLPAAPAGATDAADFLDDDPAPAGDSGWRPLGSLLLVAALGAILIALYWDEAAYFCEPRTPQDLGTTLPYKPRGESARTPPLPFVDNSYVTLSGLTGLPVVANDGRWRFYKLAFVPVWLQVGPASDPGTARTLYLTVTGRLRRIAPGSPHAAVVAHYQRVHGVAPDEAWILEAGRLPGDFWWAPLVVLLCLACPPLAVVCQRWRGRPTRTG